MKTKLLSVISLTIAAIFIPLLSIASITTLNPALESDCKKLDAPHTILIVHTLTCPYCRKFMPIAARVSELPAYKSWSFYEIDVTNLNNDSVCGKAYDGVPVSFVKNINKKNSIIYGAKEAEALQDALDGADAQ